MTRSIPGPCPFCAIVAGFAPATIHHKLRGVTVISPLNPVTEGHRLVIPDEHVEDAITSPSTTARVFKVAALLADPPCNLITSCGFEASQTIRHLHVHIVPRREGDGLKLPWSDQQRAPRDNPCQGRCEFHGRLWCDENGRTCEEFMATETGRKAPISRIFAVAARRDGGHRLIHISQDAREVALCGEGPVAYIGAAGMPDTEGWPPCLRCWGIAGPETTDIWDV